jgi:hypothetical protein
LNSTLPCTPSLPPAAALFDALGSSLSSERAVLLLYVLLHSCPRFHEYCLVRSDLDTVLLPLLELLYSAQDRTPNQVRSSWLVGTAAAAAAAAA